MPLMNNGKRSVERLKAGVAAAAFIGLVAYVASQFSDKNYSRAIQPLQHIDVTGDGVNDALVTYSDFPEQYEGDPRYNERVVAIDGNNVFQDEAGNWRTNTRDYIVLQGRTFENIDGLVLNPKGIMGFPLSPRFYDSKCGRFNALNFISEGEGDSRRLNFEFTLDNASTANFPSHYRLRDIRPVAITDFYSHSESFKKPKKEEKP